MKVAALKNNKFTVEDIPTPEIMPNTKGAVIKVRGCGLCGSDIVKFKNGTAKDGAVLGHEIVGNIVEINSDTSFKIGDRVVSGHHIPCFECNYCLDGNYSMCRHFKQTNIVPGGFSEYIFVSEEHLKNTVFKVDDKLSDIEASFTEPLACCIRAVKRAELRDNSKCLIIGLGTIGLLMGQAVNAYGNEAYGCDIIKDRVELSEKYNFKKSFVPEDEANIKNITNGMGFDRVFLTAGAKSSIDTALKSVRDGGTIIVFSSIKSDDGFKNNDIYYRELTVKSSYSASPEDLRDSLLFITSGKINVSKLSVCYPLDKINEAIDDTLSNKIMKAYITI
ncbi:alcohol dehydrogenase catalytic domain-containing protein [bacterium]|nr:alcohol dehydrogenase catalytic domain-containing protein [bacterium]